MFSKYSSCGFYLVVDASGGGEGMTLTGMDIMMVGWWPVGWGGQFPLSENALSRWVFLNNLHYVVKRCTECAIFPKIYSIPEEKLEIFEKYLKNSPSFHSHSCRVHGCRFFFLFFLFLISFRSTFQNIIKFG